MIRELSILALVLALPLRSAASAQHATAPPGPLGFVESSVSRALEIVAFTGDAIVRAASVAQLLERMQTEQLRRRDARIPASLAPDRFAAGLLLAVLTRPGAQSWPSPAPHGSSPQMEVRR